MRVSRWLVAGLGLSLVTVVGGCTESSKMTLAEMESLERRVDKQMRLVKEQNEQINSKLNIVKAELDTIKTVYIPAVSASLDSVAAKPEAYRLIIINEVENRLRTISESVAEFKKQVNDGTLARHEALTGEVKKKIDAFEGRVATTESMVNFVLAKQDSINREFAVRIDKRPWYTSILGAWDDQQRSKRNAP